MSGNLLDGLNPVTQTIDGCKALAEYLGIEGDLPETIALANGARLILSSKKDCYYTTTAKSCSCKGFTYRRTCKHVKELEGAGASSRLFSNVGVRFNLPEERSEA